MGQQPPAALGQGKSSPRTAALPDRVPEVDVRDSELRVRELASRRSGHGAGTAADQAREGLSQPLGAAAKAARSEGNTWDEIGRALGVTRQAAWERFAASEHEQLRRVALERFCTWPRRESCAQLATRARVCRCMHSGGTMSDRTRPDLWIGHVTLIVSEPIRAHDYYESLGRSIGGQGR